MLSAISLPFYDRGYWWSISPITGYLIRSNHNPTLFKFTIPTVVSNAIDSCNDPYQCAWEPNANFVKLSGGDSKRLEKMNSRLHQIGNRRFWLSYTYAGFFHPIFDTTKDAISVISQLPEQVNARADHCLQRSLLAAKTSKSFREKGVLFIGASIASADMHAWIIEDACQPDFEDRNWINFRPLLAFIAR